MDYRVPNVIKEYAAALSDEELKYLLMRLDQNFHGDAAEALSIMQQHEGIDNWLKNAKDREDFENCLDAICQQFDHESKRRSR